MRVLIFGHRGQLGRDLVKLFAKSHEVSGFDLPELDVAEREAVAEAARQFRPELVINAAAYTDVEAAEDHESEAFRANETGAANVARVAADLDAPIVYYSTDYVFGGSKRTPYEPDDATNPIGVYARSKLAGERATQAATPRHFIARTAWLYGPGGDNFVEKILRAADSRPELKVVNDEMGAPTHTWDLAEATQALTATDAYGVYHAVNKGECSRYEYAREILRLAGVRTPIHPCSSSEFPTKAERPLYSVLSTAKLERVTGYVLRHWGAALAAYMARRQS